MGGREARVAGLLGDLVGKRPGWPGGWAAGWQIRLGSERPIRVNDGGAGRLCLCQGAAQSKSMAVWPWMAIWPEACLTSWVVSATAQQGEIMRIILEGLGCVSAKARLGIVVLVIRWASCADP